MINNNLTFHVMAKPTGSICNLNCEYCFYLEKNYLYPESNFCMPDKIMNIYIRQTIEAQKTNTVTIAWQGGEPTLMGIDFFRRSIKVIERYSRPGMQIEKTLQTNGTLLNDEWCRFLRENNFLVEMLNGSPFHYTARNAGSFLPVMVNVLRTEF